MRPVFLAAARPIKDEWKMRPYLGVLPLVLSALSTAEAGSHGYEGGLGRHSGGQERNDIKNKIKIKIKSKKTHRKRAFSAPRIWTVDAGALARFVSDPACAIKRAPIYHGRARR